MLTAIYKSPRKADTYLYVTKRDDFDDVPKALLDTFGKPKFVMLIDLNKRAQLALADLDKVKSDLENNGFYLQLPPPTENMLDALKKQNGVDSAD